MLNVATWPGSVSCVCLQKIVLYPGWQQDVQISKRIINVACIGKWRGTIFLPYISRGQQVVLVARTGIEPVFQPWEGCVLTPRRTRQRVNKYSILQKEMKRGWSAVHRDSQAIHYVFEPIQQNGYAIPFCASLSLQSHRKTVIFTGYGDWCECGEIGIRARFRI